MQSLNLIAQKITTEKWHTFYIGGNKGFFVKTYVVSKDGLTENQFGSGGQFDNSPVQIKVAELVANENEERIITDYGDSAYYVIVFKNLTAEKAEVCYHTDVFKTIAEAKAYIPDATEYSDWFTETGYNASLKKPAMPEMNKQDVLKFAQYMAKFVADANVDMEKLTGEEKANSGFRLALLVATLPSKYAEEKGFSPYKSLAIIDRGVNKFKNDKDVKKILKSIDFDNK